MTRNSRRLIEPLERRAMLSAAVSLVGRELLMTGSRAAGEAITVKLTPDGLDLEATITAGSSILVDKIFALAFVTRIKVVCGTGPHLPKPMRGFEGQSVTIGDPNNNAPIYIPSVLVGGRGNDTLYGGAGADTILGGGGGDVIVGGNASNVLFGGPGNDTIFGGPAADLIVGGLGDDQIQSGGKMYPGPPPPPITSDMLPPSGDDTIFAGSGADHIVFYPDLNLAHIHFGRRDVINTIAIPPAGTGQ